MGNSRGGGRRRGAGLLVGLTCLVIAACDPTPGAITGGGSGGGAGGGGASPSLVGNWRHLMQTTTTGGETVVVETQWGFAADSSCARTTYQTFVERGQQFFETKACTYTATTAVLAVLYEGTSSPVTFPYRFQGEDLLLDGFLFIRF